MTFRHDWLKKKVYNTPSLAGISLMEQQGLLHKMQEYALMKHGQEMVVPDLAFQTSEHLYLVEIKGSPSQWCLDKFISQADRIQRWSSQEDSLSKLSIRLVRPRQKWYDEMFDMLGDLEILTYDKGDIKEFTPYGLNVS